MSGCERCDFIGPDETKTRAELRELHRAIYQFTDALLNAAHIYALANWLDRVMTRRP